jgi:hypothetical protein
MDSNVQYSSHGKELAARMDKRVHFLECKLGIIGMATLTLNSNLFIS